MVALLLAAQSLTLVPVTPQAEIIFPKAAPVTVTGLENSDKNAEHPWTHQQTLLSPRQNAAAVRFCWEIGKYDGCQVFLARPGQPVLRLKNSDVKRLLWSQDGKYLIGAGANTVRLWNLVGGMRMAVPTPGQVYAALSRHSSRIVGMSLLSRDLCVRTEDRWYERNGQQARRSVSATRYALPTLGMRQTVSTPEGQEVSCLLPVTEP